jgi:HEPN domain-containing protein
MLFFITFAALKLLSMDTPTKEKPTLEDRIQYWIVISDKDLTVGHTLFNGGHYSYVGFMCQQVVEKILKGCYVKVNQKVPPFTHDSELLARKSGIWDLLTTEQKTFVNSVTLYNIEARYPGEGCVPIQEELTKEQALEMLEQTNNLQQWIKKTILSA